MIIKIKSKELTPDLLLDKEYTVIGITNDMYRIIDEDSDPILYSKEDFVILDASRPNSWYTIFIDGAEYSYPEGINYKGFFEAYFDDDPEAVETFNNVFLSMSKRAHIEDDFKLPPAQSIAYSLEKQMQSFSNISLGKYNSLCLGTD